MYSPVLRSSVGALLFTVVVLCWGPATEAYAQTDSTLATFLKENVVENTIRFEDTDDAASYLQTLDPGRLRVVRNALFAQHGYVFDDSTLQAYFDKQNWFEAEDKDISLSSTDEANVKFVQSLEDRARSQLNSFYDKFPPCDLPVQIGEEGPVPGSGTPIDSFSVEVLLGSKYSSFARHSACCTIKQTDRYRTLLYVVKTGAGMGTSTYSAVTFDASGWRRVDQTLLAIVRSREASKKGTVTISKTEEGLTIQTKQVQTERRPVRGEWRPIRIEKTWRWFTIGADGTLDPFLEDR